MKQTYDILATEREMILVARGVAEVADALKDIGALPASHPGIDFARSLTAAADAGQRGLSHEEREARKPGPVNTHSWTVPPMSIGSARL